MLKSKVTEFNEALNTCMQLQTLMVVTGITLIKLIISHPFAEIRDSQPRNPPIFISPNANFIVPYQKNVNFTGREELLGELYMMLCDTAPFRYNHRVALYGLGGVGKTQVALQYVHTHKPKYERIFWISGAREATLFSGFEEIAKRTKCISTIDDTTPSEVAKGVVEWLNTQESWLLVIDNLDDVTVVNGYLPDPSPGRHTLITTRNRHCDHIPAKGLHVDVLSTNDATELLLTRIQDVGEADDPKHREEAIEIVKEVGCLPLAIEQAAAYIREASQDIFKFLPAYRGNSRPLHEQKPDGNSMYPYSVATTWRLSFQQIEKNNMDAVQLLRLFAFLNPDIILIDFVQLGSIGLGEECELRRIISNDFRFFKALRELERFSIIQRGKDFGSDKQPSVCRQWIRIHRLVQIVIRDDITLQGMQESVSEQVVQLGLAAFPNFGDGENRQTCRQYRSQVMSILTHLQDNDTHLSLSQYHNLADKVAR